jgi:hypothetical protein
VIHCGKLRIHRPQAQASQFRLCGQRAAAIRPFDLAFLLRNAK